MNTELEKIKEQIIFDNFRYDLQLNDEQIRYIMDNVQAFASIINEDVNTDAGEEIHRLEDEIGNKEQIIEDLKKKIKDLSDNQKT